MNKFKINAQSPQYIGKTHQSEITQKYTAILR